MERTRITFAQEEEEKKLRTLFQVSDFRTEFFSSSVVFLRSNE